MTPRAHVVLLLVTLVTIVFVVRLLRSRRLAAKYSLLWMSIGVVLVGMAAFPPFLDKVSSWLGIYYGPATFFLGAIALLFLIVVHFSWELTRLEDRTRTLAEEIALLRAEQDAREV
jgi:hypothetical protein